MSDRVSAALLHFLYQVPVGLIETDAALRVVRVNPAAARLLAPVLGDRDLTVLEPVLAELSPPLLAALVTSVGATGRVANGERFVAQVSEVPELWVELQAVRVDRARVMVVLLDHTREHRLLRDQRARALEVNDGILQQVLAAEMALDVGDLERARRLVVEASAAGRTWIGEQLRSLGPVGAGSTRIRHGSPDASRAEARIR